MSLKMVGSLSGSQQHRDEVSFVLGTNLLVYIHKLARNENRATPKTVKEEEQENKLFRSIQEELHLLRFKEQT